MRVVVARGLNRNISFVSKSRTIVVASFENLSASHRPAPPRAAPTRDAGVSGDRAARPVRQPGTLTLLTNCPLLPSPLLPQFSQIDVGTPPRPRNFIRI